MDKNLFESVPKVYTHFNEKAKITIHTGDTIEFSKTIPDNSIDLIITSPPYNIGKEYEVRKSIKSYLGEQNNLIQILINKLKDTGSICWQVGNYVEKSEVFPLDIFYYELFKDVGMRLRNRIIWYFGHGLHATKRFSGRYETILWFTKTDKFKFNLDSVRVPSKYPGKRSWKGPDRGKPTGNPLGKNPSDIWQIVAQDWESGLWDIPNVKSNHPEKTNHPCQFPIELIQRCILALTNVEDIVYDPFGGVGSTAIASLSLKRRSICCEKEERYNKTAVERINSYYNGKLKIRPIGKPVHIPTGKERVSQIPDEWKLINSDSESLQGRLL